MEENVGESDIDVDDKNNKIATIKNSTSLSIKINEQSLYL
jgi:hypothetical protein